MEKAKRPFIIDCDTGTDDAIAEVAALFWPTVHIEGITTVDGNVEVKYTSKNTLDLVDYVGLKTPVAIGAERGFNQRFNFHNADRVTHGRKGLGPLQLPASKQAFAKETAIDMIWNAAQKYKGKLEILAVGPLTNVAMAFLQYPDLKKLVKHIWIMGGAAHGGNVSPTAEFNIWVDPESAKTVFRMGVPITMVGLDVTLQAVLNEEDEAAYRKIGTPGAALTADLLKFMFKRRDAGGEDAVMHDALGFAAAVYPQCLTTRHVFVDVECQGEYTFGHTYVDLRGRSGKAPNANVALGIDLPKFKAFMLEAMENTAKYGTKKMTMKTTSKTAGKKPATKAKTAAKK